MVKIWKSCYWEWQSSASPFVFTHLSLLFKSACVFLREISFDWNPFFLFLSYFLPGDYWSVLLLNSEFRLFRLFKNAVQNFLQEFFLVACLFHFHYPSLIYISLSYCNISALPYMIISTGIRHNRSWLFWYLWSRNTEASHHFGSWRLLASPCQQKMIHMPFESTYFHYLNCVLVIGTK